MALLSQPIQALLQSVKSRHAETPQEFDFDVVIVGSGYGGSVAACRLSALRKANEESLKVCVLERGREYQPGEFPEDITRLWPHVQVDSAVGAIGRRDALFDVRGNHGVSVLVGCALGGTSQINANVVLRPDRNVFEKTVSEPTGVARPVWPTALRNVSTLKPYFEKVEEMLEAQPFPSDPSEPLPKLRALERLSFFLRQADDQPVTFERPPIAVQFKDGDNRSGVAQKKCSNCGNCCTGCNGRAKNTLTMNYLAVAHRQGAELYTQALVTRIAEDPKVRGAWLIYLEPNQPRGPSEGIFVRAANVILAAGVLGTNEILLRSTRPSEKSDIAPLSLSGRLGRRFSCNGDSVNAGYDHIDFVHASQLNSSARVGPCITGMIKVRPNNGQIADDLGAAFNLFFRPFRMVKIQINPFFNIRQLQNVFNAVVRAIVDEVQHELVIAHPKLAETPQAGAGIHQIVE